MVNKNSRHICWCIYGLVKKLSSPSRRKAPTSLKAFWLINFKQKKEKTKRNKKSKQGKRKRTKQKKEEKKKK